MESQAQGVRAFMCRRGEPCKLVEDGRILNPDLRPDLPVGQVVIHPRYGRGTIIQEAGTACTRRITVRFSADTKTFVAAVVKQHLVLADSV